MAGKVRGCGAIILYCLNLPPDIRYRPDYVFILGLIPGPSAPDVITISHILLPFSKTFRAMWEPGAVVATPRFPAGKLVKVQVQPLIADLGAIRKLAGYLSHAATMFCSFCKLPLTDKDNLRPDTWEYRTDTEVRRLAEKYKNIREIGKKENLAKATGVRWTPLHDLPYWDTVSHLILGFMHNTIEGILAHHLRILWGIGRTDRAAEVVEEFEQEEKFTESDAWDSADELITLEQEAAQHILENTENDQNIFAARRRTRSASSTTTTSLDEKHSTPKATPALTPQTLPPDTDAEMSDAGSEPDDTGDGASEDDNRDTNYIPGLSDKPFNFTPNQLAKIRHCIQTVRLPTWVHRPPGNLGEKRHGKLTAQDVLILFTAIFPLVIPEIWDGDTLFDAQLLNNFYDLVASTNIVASYTTSIAEADRYMEHFTRYRISMGQLFPFFASLPNHHYAMHNGQLLKHWGPMASLSEFPGERALGVFQRIKTNRHLGESAL